ncbi:MAG: hypothetical protein AB3N11_09565 [Arenibacterium sp.]
MLKLSLIAGLSAVFWAQAPSIAVAQAAAAAGQAQAEARGRVVCGSGTLVSAEYLPGGLLRVTCSQQTQTSSASSAAIAGTGLATAPILGAVLGVSIIGIVGGGGSPGQTTGTTPSSSVTTTSSTR